jgi:hypothetical protein
MKAILPRSSVILPPFRLFLQVNIFPFILHSRLEKISDIHMYDLKSFERPNVKGQKMDHNIYTA